MAPSLVSFVVDEQLLAKCLRSNAMQGMQVGNILKSFEKLSQIFATLAISLHFQGFNWELERRLQATWAYQKLA